MDDHAEQRYRLFIDRGLSTALEHDKVLVTLFTGIVAGLIALVVSGKVGPWSGAFFLLSAGIAVLGLAFSLLHMSFTAKVMNLYAAHFMGEENVPNVVEGEEPTVEALTRNMKNAQRCYTNQLTHLMGAVFFASLGLTVMLWSSVKLIALIVVGLVILILLLIGIGRVFRRAPPSAR